MNPLDQFLSFLDSELNRRLGGPEELAKAEVLEKKMKEDGYGRKGLIFDPFVPRYLGRPLPSQGPRLGFPF